MLGRRQTSLVSLTVIILLTERRVIITAIDTFNNMKLPFEFLQFLNVSICLIFGIRIEIVKLCLLLTSVTLGRKRPSARAAAVWASIRCSVLRRARKGRHKTLPIARILTSDSLQYRTTLVLIFLV